MQRRGESKSDAVKRLILHEGNLRAVRTLCGDKGVASALKYLVKKLRELSKAGDEAAWTAFARHVAQSAEGLGLLDTKLSVQTVVSQQQEALEKCSSAWVSEHGSEEDDTKAESEEKHVEQEGNATAAERKESVARAPRRTAKQTSSRKRKAVDAKETKNKKEDKKKVTNQGKKQQKKKKTTHRTVPPNRSYLPHDSIQPGDSVAIIVDAFRLFLAEQEHTPVLAAAQRVAMDHDRHAQPFSIPAAATTALLTVTVDHVTAAGNCVQLLWLTEMSKPTYLVHLPTFSFLLASDQFAFEAESFTRATAATIIPGMQFSVPFAVEGGAGTSAAGEELAGERKDDQGAEAEEQEEEDSQDHGRVPGYTKVMWLEAIVYHVKTDAVAQPYHSLQVVWIEQSADSLAWVFTLCQSQHELSPWDLWPSQFISPEDSMKAAFTHPPSCAPEDFVANLGEQHFAPPFADKSILDDESYRAMFPTEEERIDLDGLAAKAAAGAYGTVAENEQQPHPALLADARQMVANCKRFNSQNPEWLVYRQADMMDRHIDHIVERWGRPPANTEALASLQKKLDAATEEDSEAGVDTHVEEDAEADADGDSDAGADAEGKGDSEW